jgi:hypothetical protein
MPIVKSKEMSPICVPQWMFEKRVPTNSINLYCTFSKMASDTRWFFKTKFYTTDFEIAKICNLGYDEVIEAKKYLVDNKFIEIKNAPGFIDIAQFEKNEIITTRIDGSGYYYFEDGENAE